MFAPWDAAVESCVEQTGTPAVWAVCGLESLKGWGEDESLAALWAGSVGGC